MKIHPFRVSGWFLAHLLLFLFLTLVVGQEGFTMEELTAMTDDELEQICVKRGFTILRDAIDPATGKPYDLSHDDFVEAARQCLEIEQEMNELLAEYPELRAEVEEELEKLEAEKNARLAEVERLEKELEKAQEAAEEKSNSSSGPAFVASTETEDKTETSEEDEDFVIIDDGDSTAQVENDVPPPVEEEEIVVEEEPIQNVTKNATEVANMNKSTEDFTMKAISFEVLRATIKEIENDLKRLVELMTPVIRPILRAGDIVWRHLRVALESLRSNYEQSKSGEEGKVQEAVAS